MNRHRPGRIRFGWVIGFAIFILLAAWLGRMGFNYLQPEVNVTQVVEGNVVQAFYATGTVSPDREYPIRSNVAGIIKEMLVDKGDHVKKGQPVAKIEDDELSFHLKQTKAELVEKEKMAEEPTSPALMELDARITANKEIYEIAQRETVRMQGMMDKSVASQQDLDRTLDRLKGSLADFESSKAQRVAKKLQLEKDVAVARAAVDTAQWNYDLQIVRSPIDGVVLDRPSSIGTRVAINDHLMQVADVTPSKLVMRAAVDEEDKVKLHADQLVHMTLYSFPDQVLTGRVAKIYDKAESTRRTFEVDVAFDPADKRREELAPGMTGELAFVVASRDKAQVVPAQAVQKGEVWLVRDGRLVRADVKIGLRSVERVEVLEGLAANDDVVISPIITLEQGQRVRTNRVDPQTAAGLNRVAAKEVGFRGKFN